LTNTDNDLINELRDKAEVEGAGSTRRLLELAARRIEELKEHEPMTPKKENDGKPGKWATWWYVCGNCGGTIDYHDRFCRFCGRRVKWE
jgi:rubrerythrin